MTTSNVYPSPIPATTSYRYYFARADTNTFRGNYAVVLATYVIDPDNAANDAAPANVVRLIYAVAQEGVPTVLLQCHQGARRRGVQIALLHSVSNYVPRMGLPASPWDNRSFASKGDITCETIACANWLPEILHHIRATVHVPMGLAIDSALTDDLDTDLLGTFSSMDAKVEPLHARKTIYPPATFFGIFLNRDFTPVEA